MPYLPPSLRQRKLITETTLVVPSDSTPRDDNRNSFKNSSTLGSFRPHLLGMNKIFAPTEGDFPQMKGIVSRKSAASTVLDFTSILNNKVVEIRDEFCYLKPGVIIIPFEQIERVIADSIMYRVQLTFNYSLQIMDALECIKRTNTSHYSDAIKIKNKSYELILVYLLLQDLLQLKDLINDSSRKEVTMTQFDNIWQHALVIEEFFGCDGTAMLKCFLDAIVDVSEDKFEIDLMPFEFKLAECANNLNQNACTIQVGIDNNADGIIHFISVSNGYETISDITLNRDDILNRSYFEINDDMTLEDFLNAVNKGTKCNSIHMFDVKLNGNNYLFECHVKEEILAGIRQRTSFDIIGKPNGCSIISSFVNPSKTPLLDVPNYHAIHQEHQVNAWLKVRRDDETNASLTEYVYDMLRESDVMDSKSMNDFAEYCYDNSS
jgi:hypothetical protein